MTDVVVLTGASGTVGSLVLDGLIASGYPVVATCTSEHSLRQLVNLSKKTSSIYPLKIDLEIQKGIDQILNFMQDSKLSPIHLINSARSIEHLTANAGGLPDREVFTRDFHLQVVAPYQLTIGIVNQSGSKLKSVVNVASQYGVVAVHHKLVRDKNATPLHYSVNKAAVIQLTRELAVRLAPKSIRVNCVSLGGVEGRASAEFSNKYSDLSPRGCMMKREEVFGAFKFLISDAANGITGHNLVVDGGWTVV